MLRLSAVQLPYQLDISQKSRRNRSQIPEAVFPGRMEGGKTNRLQGRKPVADGLPYNTV